MMNRTRLLPTGLSGLIVLLMTTACTIDYAKYARAQRCNGLFSYERQVKLDPAIEQEFYKAAKQYSGEGIHFVDYFKRVGRQHCGRPALDYMLYLKGYLHGKPKTDFQSMVSSVGTAIHETAHHYSSMALQFDPQPRSRRMGYHTFGHTSVYTKSLGLRHLFHTQTFPAKEIHRVIKDKQVLKGSRYTTYIGEASPYHVTQQFGIYGLLDEFHAYYYSIITKNNILKQLNAKQRRVSQGDNTFTELGNNDIDLSYLEFKLFILSYFRTAEQYYPKIYQQLLSNRELIEVVITLHDEFDQAYQESTRIMAEQKQYDSFKKERAILVNELALPENRAMLHKLQEAKQRLKERLSKANPHLAAGA
ncbi:MAG: hypothetical protein OEZ39_08360 [Gammaproteobacteria bacterium]|nr:hypothetical protein [Gammaproteobacteria bacterium]MDH5651874.1 hypothetical protein [Gammaproteobacteria bacterium]